MVNSFIMLKRKKGDHMSETIYETYVRTICRNCINKETCNEELRKRIDNTIKCDSYERKD